MKYWVYMNGEVPGCYTPLELRTLPNFSDRTLLCPAEGELLEKNWRRSAEFPDIVEILQERDAPQAPRAPAPASEPATADVNQLIDASSSRLFNHITDLIKELESRREERALAQSLQRQVDTLTRELNEKQLSLEKALGVIRRLEEELRRLVPTETALAAATPPAPPPPALPQADRLPQTPAQAAPAAPNAVVDLLKRFLSKDLYS